MNALEMRVARAKTMKERGLRATMNADGTWSVPSDGLPGQHYRAVIKTGENGFLYGAHCTCPDWRQQFIATFEGGKDVATLHYAAVCKHVLLVVLQERLVEFIEPQTAKTAAKYASFF